jgi:hypothetical protein
MPSPKAAPVVATSLTPSPAADEMQSRLHAPLSEVLRVAPVCNRRFGNPDDPTGEMLDDGACYGRD